MEVSLVMFKADGTRRDFPLTKPRLVIGRINSCDLRIPLSSVSRQHCEIRINGDAVMVKDLGSSNGTFVNDIRITEQALEAGDAVTVGPVVFTLVLDGEPAEIEPVRTVLDGETGARRTEKMGRTQEMESGSLTSTGHATDEEPGDSGDSLVTLDDDVAGDEDEPLPLSDDEADGLESLASAADARSGRKKDAAAVSDDDVVDDDDVLDESDLLSDFDDGPQSSPDADTVDDSNDALPVLGDDDSAVMELLDPDEKPASKKPASPPKKDAAPPPSFSSDDSALPLLGDDEDEEDPISALEALASAGDEDDEPEEEKPAKDAKKRGRRRR